MSLSSLSLDAFLAVAQAGGFSAAAKALHLTQSALSQRIKNLEEELELTLFLRGPMGVTLTEEGERLLRYGQIRNSLEAELLAELGARTSGRITGTIRIGAYSSVLRSVVIPSLSPLLKKHPGLGCRFVSAGLKSLPGMLQRGEVDFILLDYDWKKANLVAKKIGKERFVLVEPEEKSARRDVFLDNDSDDRATELFFEAQGKSFQFRRAYLGDGYGILDGVAAGLGSAVVSAHLLKQKKKIRVLPSRPHSVDVVLHYHHQPFYSQLHQAVVAELATHAPRYLG